MKKILSLIIVGVLCFSIFSVLAPPVKAQTSDAKILTLGLAGIIDDTWSFPNGTTFTFRGWLQSKGFSVSTVSEAFPTGEITLSGLQDFQAILAFSYFFGDPANVGYIGTILDYVSLGGGLILLGQSSRPSITIDEAFGFCWSGSAPGPIDPWSFYVDAEITDYSHPIMQGITELPKAGGVFVDWDTLIDETPLPSNTAVLARTLGTGGSYDPIDRIAMIAFQYGNGNVVAGPWDGLARPYGPTAVNPWDAIAEPIVENKLLINAINWIAGARAFPWGDDFETYTVGSFPSAEGWELVWNGKGTQYQVVTDIISHSPTKSLQLWGQSGWSANVQRKFTSNSETIGFEAYVRTESNSGSGWKIAGVCFWTLESDVPWGKRFADIAFGEDGELYTRPVKGSSSFVPLGLTYEADRWYKVRVIIDRIVETYDVWIDDILVAEDVGIWDTYEIDALMLESGHSAVKVYFDDVKVFARARRFDPLIDGFGFDNYGLEPGDPVYTLKQIYDQLELLLPPTVVNDSPVLLAATIYAYYTFHVHSIGHCYGISHAAVDYFSNPNEIPSSYENVHEIATKDEAPSVQAKVEWYQQNQIFDVDSLLKHIGYDVGLSSLGSEIQSIAEMLDQSKPALVAMGSPQGWHMVVAYDYTYNSSSDSYFIKFYDSNGHITNHNRTMEFTQTSSGEYDIQDDGDTAYNWQKVINTYGPVSWTWDTIANNIKNLVNWLRNKIADLWDKLLEFADQATDIWTSFIDWVIENAKDFWSRIVHFELHSPANLHLYDADGNHVGLTDAGGLEIGFPALFFVTSDTQQAVLVNPNASDYHVEVVGTGNGSFTLDISSIVNGTTIRERSISGEINEEEIVTYQVSYEKSGELIFKEAFPWWIAGVVFAVVVLAVGVALVIWRKRATKANARESFMGVT